MRNNLFALSLALVLALAPCAAVNAQDMAAQGAWSAVETVAPGNELVIDMKSGERIQGRFAGATAATLIITQKKTDIRIERGEIQRVFRHRSTSHSKGALTGAAVGGAAGIISGVGVHSAAKGDIVPGMTPALGLVGAGIGAIFGRGRKKVLLYEAR